MPPAYKLTYFNIRGLAEPIRFLFHYGEIEFEDNRIAREDWLRHKQDMPFGQMPLLEYDGKSVNQSVAIARYVAKQVKLAGNDDWEDLEIDSFVDTFNDLRAKITPLLVEKDDEKKSLIREKLLSETFPYYLSRFEEKVLQNGGYLCLGRLTWADFYFVSMTEFINQKFEENVFENYPNLAALSENILSIPAIQKWVESRPKTDY